MKLRNIYFEKKDSNLKVAMMYLIVITFCLVAVYPLLNVLSISLRPGDQLFSMSLRIIPENWSFANYREVIFEKDLLLWLRNSFIISILTAVISVAFSVTAAYSFSRFRFWGRKMGMMTFLVTQMFPAPMLLLPTYVILVKLGLINKFAGLLIPYVAMAVPFSVWNLKGYFDTIPKSLEESAYIDGCNVWQSMIRIVLPLSLPALAITGLFSFMVAWSEFVIARIILTKANMLTLPLGLIQLQGEFATSWGLYSAAAIITTLPVVIMFIGLSKFIVGGLTVGGVKE
jgi:arabinogalactan oligomer/maltooligosaccharide transport system permease protein